MLQYDFCIWCCLKVFDVHMCRTWTSCLQHIWERVLLGFVFCLFFFFNLSICYLEFEYKWCNWKHSILYSHLYPQGLFYLAYQMLLSECWFLLRVVPLPVSLPNIFVSKQFSSAVPSSENAAVGERSVLSILGNLVWCQELNLIPLGPFQLWIFCDSINTCFERINEFLWLCADLLYSIWMV